MTKKQLAEILDKHKKWLNGEEGGERANLSGANLSRADLSRANLSGANLDGVIADECTSGYFSACPEDGAFVGYKKCSENRIVKLLIPEDARRSSATTRKCRCSKAVVLEITGIDGRQYDTAESRYDRAFVYKVGETVEVENFDGNRWHECSRGIHFFITRAEAEAYHA